MAKRSNRKIIEKLYNDNKQLMYKIAFSVLQNPEQAEDAVHSAFIRFMNEPSRIFGYSINENKKYLFIMVKGIALDMLERNSKAVELTEDFPSTYNTYDAAETKYRSHEIILDTGNYLLDLSVRGIGKDELFSLAEFVQKVE